ncbi:MAG: acyltransferase [Spirochaetales bacterium]|nr:acyltransferase [Spirochaetales bacterium]
MEFISRYKGLLATLVVLIHTGVTYGGIGGWDFVETHDVLWLKVLATTITSLSQSFVLGAFFFISACFLPRSLANKGPGRFLLDRLVKLGIPYLLYYFLIMPVLVALGDWGEGEPFGLGSYFDDCNSGPLWFIEALFLFTMVYLLTKLVRKSPGRKLFAPGLPYRGMIVAYMMVAGALGFAVRLVFPIGWTFHNLQLGFFPMYVILFAAGIKAGEERWLDRIAELRLAPWLPIAVTGMVLYLPFMILGGALSNEGRPFLGGMTWQAAAYALWEAAAGTSLFIATLVLFARRRWPASGAGASYAGASFGIYLLHATVIIPLAIAMQPLPVHPALKWIILSVSGVCLPWALTLAFRRVPGIHRVLGY